MLRTTTLKRANTSRFAILVFILQTTIEVHPWASKGGIGEQITMIDDSFTPGRG